MRKNLVAVLTVALSLLFMTGCTGDEGDRSKVWSESDIVEHMGLRSNGDGLGWTFQAGSTTCHVPLVLTTASEVETYAGAGDTVATNPDQTAGIKIVGEPKEPCVDAAEEALEDLE